MAFEQRDTVDYFSTSLLSAMTISATTMQSADFASKLPVYDGANGKYLPLVIHDDAVGVYEIVWVSTHVAAANTVTVVRGKQGTSAQPWSAGARVECAPTAFDTLLAKTAATLPSDPYIGQRVNRGDKADVLERVNGYWAPSVGVGIASDQGPNMNGTQAPVGATFLKRMGSVLATTSASGTITVAYVTVFPNNTQHVSVTSTFINGGGNFAVGAVRANGFDIILLADSAGNRKPNFLTSFTYEATGW